MILAQTDQILDRGNDSSPPWAVVDQKKARPDRVKGHIL